MIFHADDDADDSDGLDGTDFADHGLVYCVIKSNHITQNLNTKT